MKAYDDNLRSSIISGLELDPVAPELTKFLWDKTQGEEVVTLSATELMELITPPDHKNRPSNWPKTAQHFSAQLGRISPALREIGIELTRGRVSEKRMVIIHKDMSGYKPEDVLSTDDGRHRYGEQGF